VDGSTAGIGAAHCSGSGCRGCTVHCHREPSHCCPLHCPQPGCPPSPGGCTHPQGWLLHPRALALQHQLQRHESRGLDVTRVTQHPLHPGPRERRRERLPETPPAPPAICPRGGEGKATSVAELTPPEQEWVVTEWPFAAQAAKPGVARLPCRPPNSQEQNTDTPATHTSMGTDMP